MSGDRLIDFLPESCWIVCKKDPIGLYFSGRSINYDDAIQC
jgi:hypothetical protein